GVICRTPPELAYQLYLLDLILRNCMAELAGQPRYVDELAKYGRFALFTVCTKALKTAHAAFGEPNFSAFLETESRVAPTAPWRVFCKSGVGAIWNEYKKYRVRYKKKTGKDPALANFAKSQEYLGKFIEGPSSRHLRRLAKGLLN